MTVDYGNIRGRFDPPLISTCVERLEGLFGEGKKKKGAVLKLYLNNFKSYNDSFGFKFGGLLIDEITAFLEAIDEADIYHIRGVEYVLIIETSSRAVIKTIIDSILQRFEEAWHVNSIECMCSVNAGVIYFPGHANTPDEVIEFLELAISESSRLGLNYLVEYDEEFIKKHRRKSVIAKQIPNCLKTGGIEMLFRPTFKCSTGRYSRIDCRMRMFCEGLGLVGEAEIYPVAEQSGQINSVGSYAISKACELVSYLIKQKQDFETVAIKISPLQFLQDRFVRDVAEMIEEAGIPANRLAFEVDEVAAQSVFPRTHMCMHELSEMGIEMILTDFGTGSFGVSNILSMSIDVVKITRSLIWQMDNTPNGASVVDGLIIFANKLGLKLIADGVETEAQAKMLAEFGCEYQQGRFFVNAVPANELIPILKSR